MTASEVDHIDATLPARSRAGASILGGVRRALAGMRRALAGVPSPVWGAGAALLLVAAIAGWIAVVEPPTPREYFVALPAPEANTVDAPTPTAEPSADITGIADQDLEPVARVVAPAAPPREPPQESEPVEKTAAAEPPAGGVADDPIAAVTPPLPLAEHESIIDAGALPVAADALVRTSKMVPAPHPDLVEHADVGPLPRVGPDGRQPWQVYARPFDDADTRPRIAIVIESLGMRRSTTFTAIELPGTVTLAFAPYAKGLDNWIKLAREATHEILLELPMEPESYPRDDPGPRALLTSLGPDENLDRLDWLLSRFVGYVGVMPFQGSAFTGSAEALAPVARALRDRGLIYLDRSGRAAEARQVATDTGLYWVGLDLRVDNAPSRKTIAARFAEAERLAKDRGSAVVIAQPLPLTVALIKEWLAGLDEKGIAAAPLTAVFARRAAAVPTVTAQPAVAEPAVAQPAVE